MSFPAHERYKESRRDWLGMVPDHWRLAPFWSLFRRTKRTGFPGAELLSVYRDYGVIRKADRDDNFNNASEDLSTYQLVEPGDLAMNKMKAWQGSLGVSTHRGIVSPAYFVFQAQHAEDPSFLHYLLRSCGYAVGFMTISKGIRIGQWDLDPDHLGTVPIPLPPLPEQRAIAAFLDRETAKIDALVEAQRRLIELLKEKRQAVISHAVTKGLDPSAPMKDSGVEWLGEVPAHWDVRPLKHLVSLRSGGTPSKEREDYWSGEIPWASAKDLKSDYLSDTQDHLSQEAVEDGAASLTPAGSVLVLVRGMMLARLFPVSRTEVPMAINQDLKALVGKAGVQNSFLAWLLRGTERETLNRLDEAGHGTKALRMDAWLSMPLPLPPESEQEQIVQALETELTRLDGLSARAVAAVTILQERRTALISAAVTGKVDVRGLVQTAEAA
jgi:type I restriction enzyme S subunit